MNVEPIKSFLSNYLYLESAKPSEFGSIFSFAEFVALLALLLVIYTVTDFKFRFRLALSKYHLKKISFIGSIIVGIAILLIDLWFKNQWPIPHILNNEIILQTLLGSLFFGMIFYLYSVSAIKPPRFMKRNAKNYFFAVRHFVGEGNPDRLAVVAEALGYSAEGIFSLASEIKPRKSGKNKKQKDESPEYAAIAHNLILIFGNEKLCRVMVDKVPWAVAEIFSRASEYSNPNIPIWQFSKNIGQELILNLDSSLYHEEHGYYSGYFGYTKPISKAVFGNSNFVEHCAAENRSPLDVDFYKLSDLKPEYLKGFSRASLLFCEDFFEKNNSPRHSYAFVRLIETFKYAVVDLYKLDGIEGDFWSPPQNQRLQITVTFIRDLIKLLDEHDVVYEGSLKPVTSFSRSVHDDIAELIFKVIFAASKVTKPSWTCWVIQNNEVWARLFHFEDSKTHKIIRFKVRRLLYDEIKKMNEFPNYQGARILGYCLNVFGLKEGRFKGSLHKESYPLRKVALNWAKQNYLTLHLKLPDVAEVSIQGGLSFDPKRKKLVKTYAKGLSRKAPKDILQLADPRK